jgi:aryl-alcohol dehydrogenase-like predicted oxidoreductase
MPTRELGAGGPRVSAIGLGCWSFGGGLGPTTESESLRCMDAALDQGIDFFDTANIYGMGVSETAVGTWLATRRPRITLATKAGIVNGPPRSFDNSEAHLRTELEGSLRRLGVDHVDLFYIHRRDARVPVEDMVGTLKRLIDEGKIGGYGLSEVAPATLRRAHAVHPCRAVQNEYSLWSRLPDLGMIRACAELGVAFVAFSPLGRGIFGRRPVDPATFAANDFRRTIPRFQADLWPRNLVRIRAFHDWAAARGLPAPAVALAWVLAQGDHVIPIPGTRHADHVSDWAQAAALTLTPEDRAAIDRLLPPGWAEGDRYGVDAAMAVERYA